MLSPMTTPVRLCLLAKLGVVVTSTYFSLAVIQLKPMMTRPCFQFSHTYLYAYTKSRTDPCDTLWSRYNGSDWVWLNSVLFEYIT